MKKKYALFIVSLITISILLPVLPANTTIIINNTADQERMTMNKLQWYSPNGELPGTYQEYLRSHPLTSAHFSSPIKNNGLIVTSSSTLSLLVHEDLYPLIETSLSRYIADLEYEGYYAVVQTVSGGTPEDIKAWVQNQYSKNSQGILFVGDITAAWAVVSGETFPCDLFYMDLDGLWEDANGDGIYESHTDGDGDMAPELYVGRLYASTLSYDAEATMVNEYFSKIHAYRTGELTQPWRGLEYIEEDWYDMDVNLDLVYGTNVSRYDYGYFTTAEDYLNQMEAGQHFVQVCVHSYSGGHYFSTRPTEAASYAHVYVYSPTTRPAKLLLGSDDGLKVWLNRNHVFTADRYGSWHQDGYKINVTLNEGWNQLLCKVSQEGGDYRFSARFTDMNEITFSDLQYQMNNPVEYGGEADYIRSFLLNGFHQDISDNFWNYLTTNYLGVNEPSINPYEGDSMGGHLWASYNEENPYINLGAYCDDADYGVCYAFTRVIADAQKTCELWMGYDDGARVWLNGAEVIFDNRYGGLEADMKKVQVTLQTGENRLLIKISEWMGDHGFTVRFCNPDGSSVNGLTYDPSATPITYIGTWLANGAYANPDRTTRLSTDYLGDEGNTTPSENDPESLGTWTRGIGEGCPFNLGGHFDHGDWVLSQTIQEHDPPVLFYNLFACGPGRFTDENYLAGSYLFHTTYGLITIASAKSGSMLNFDDFNRPLGEGASIGEAFQEWFEAQAPYSTSDKEWFYGMVLLGDPTLCIPTATQMKIIKPENAVYLFDKKILPFFVPLSIGKITIEATASNPVSGVERLEFYLDNELKATLTNEPYLWSWNEPSFFRHTIKVLAYDTFGHNTTRQFTVWKFL